MKSIQVEWKGVTPLIMHSCKCVNPLHPLTIEIAKISGLKKKTEADYKQLSDFEWEAGVYWDDGVGLYIPAENIEATVREGAKQRKKGKDIERAFNCRDMTVPLDIGEKKTYEQLIRDYRFRDVRAMRVKNNRIARTRPRFNMWRINFFAYYDENLLNLATIADAMEFAGKYVGLCDSRPKYGQFSATITELD